MSAPLAVLRFPRVLAQRKGRYAVTTPDGTVVMALDVSERGRQVDVTGPDAAPLGRIFEAKGNSWHLIAPGTGTLLASAETRWGIRVRIGAGPETNMKGRGDEWDLVWERTTLLAARKVPRKVAKHCVDLWVTDPACTPAVVAFVVHVHRWMQAVETSNQLLLQQTLTTPPPPPTY